VAAEVTDDDAVAIDVRGLADEALLFQALKRHPNSPDFIGKGTFQGMPFKVTGVCRTSKTGRGMLKLFLTPLKSASPREPPRG
jgi:hypothetical protein